MQRRLPSHELPDVLDMIEIDGLLELTTFVE
jgi:hypothetical protein